MSASTSTPRLILSLGQAFRSSNLNPRSVRSWNITASTVRPLDLCRPRSFSTCSTRYAKPTSNDAFNPASSTTTSTLGTAGTEAPGTGTGTGTQSTVGPFPIGVGMKARNQKWKKWKELGVGGKVVRTTAQTGNLAVIILGGTLFLALTYALTTEMFASNSPMVLQNEAIKMIEKDSNVKVLLLPPFAYTHSPLATSTSTRSTPQIQSQHLCHPTTHNEHLIIRFWVHGKSLGERWGVLQSLRWGIGEGWKGVKEVGWEGVELVRDWLDDGTEQVIDENQNTQKVGDAITKVEEKSNWFTSVFGPIKSNRKSGLKGDGNGGKGQELPVVGTWTVGQANADYVKDENGKYKLLTLTLEVPPHSSASSSRKIAIFREENELVAREGLLEGGGRGGGGVRLRW